MGSRGVDMQVWKQICRSGLGFLCYTHSQPVVNVGRKGSFAYFLPWFGRLGFELRRVSAGSKFLGWGQLNAPQWMTRLTSIRKKGRQLGPGGHVQGPDGGMPVRASYACRNENVATPSDLSSRGCGDVSCASRRINQSMCYATEKRN